MKIEIFQSKDQQIALKVSLDQGTIRLNRQGLNA